LTKKLKFINKLDISFEFVINTQLLKIIAQNCQYLKKIAFCGRDIGQYYEVIGQKYGQKLESIGIYGINCQEMALLLR
jgi:hypothetical protein